MKRFLLATAAVVALALAMPMAGAQSTTTDPYYTQTTPPPVDSQTTVEDENMEPNLPAIVAPTTTAQPSVSTTTAQTHDPAHGSTMDHSTDQTYTTATTTTTTTTTDQYATQSSADTFASASMQEHAIEAGLQGVPMTAVEVCEPREVDLGGTRLSHATRKQLRFAADRASACEVNQVTINAPAGRAESVRQVLLEHGFDEADIQIQEASALGVEMQFAGVATSSEYYASIFNPHQQLALNESATTGSAYAPSSMPPNDPNTSMNSMPEDTTTTTEPMDHGADDPDQATMPEDTTL